MKYLKKLTVAMISCLIFTMPMTSAFAAFEGLSMMRMGAWEVDFSGNVNAFATIGECDPQIPGTLVGGGLACLLNGNDEDYTDVRDGLLPSWFNFSAATVTDSGIRTSVHLSFQPGTATGASAVGAPRDGALGLNEANFRQVFLTFGTEEWGTIKIGRDLGVFGSDAILQDMTLLGVGSGANFDGHTTLGRIGVGYLYADWKSQVQYTSPNMNGFTFTAAIVDPWGAGSLGAWDASELANSVLGLALPDNTLPGLYSRTYSNIFGPGKQEDDTFGFEAKLNYDWTSGDSSAKFWAGYIRQDLDFTDDGEPLTNDSAEADGYEMGVKWGHGSFDVVGYYYDGEGIGTTGFLLDGLDLLGNERDSDGFYLQGRYRMPTGTLLGLSYGESSLDETAADRVLREADRVAVDTHNRANPNDLRAPNYNLVDTNESVIVGLYHPIGEALNLVLEYTDTESESHNGITNEEKTLAIGAIMFF